MRQSLNWIAASLSSRNEGSILSTYAGDDRTVWKELRRELVEEGYSSNIIAAHKITIMNYVKELGERGVLDETATADEVPPPVDVKQASTQSSGTGSSEPAVLSEADGMDTINDGLAKIHYSIIISVLEHTVDSFSVKIYGWEFPRMVSFVDGFVYFQVSTCYPCSVCEFRIKSLETALGNHTNSRFRASRDGAILELPRNRLYAAVEVNQMIFFLFPYTGLITPQDISDFLTRKLGLHFTVERGYGQALHLPIVATN